MNEATKMKRLLLLIQYLQSNKSTLPEIANEFQVSTKTIQRYLKLLSETGFQVKQDGFPKKFWIVPNGHNTKEINQIAEKTFENITPKRRYSNLVELLDSPFLRKKPFIVALYGEYNQNNASKFSNKITNYHNLSFNQDEIKVIVAMLQTLRSHIDFLLE